MSYSDSSVEVGNLWHDLLGWAALLSTVKQLLQRFIQSLACSQICSESGFRVQLFSPWVPSYPPGHTLSLFKQLSQVVERTCQGHSTRIASSTFNNLLQNYYQSTPPWQQSQLHWSRSCCNCISVFDMSMELGDWGVPWHLKRAPQSWTGPSVKVSE